MIGGSASGGGARKGRGGQWGLRCVCGRGGGVYPGLGSRVGIACRGTWGGGGGLCVLNPGLVVNSNNYVLTLRALESAVQAPALL